MARRLPNGRVVPASEAGMKEFEVTVRRGWTRTNYYTETGFETATVTVKATDEDSARTMVEEMDESDINWDGDIDWRGDDDFSDAGDPEMDDDDFEIEEVKEL